MQFGRNDQLFTIYLKRSKYRAAYQNIDFIYKTDPVLFKIIMFPFEKLRKSVQILDG